MRSNFNFAVIWTMAFIVFFAYFFQTASIVAFEEGFLESVQDMRYPSDFSKNSSWSAKEYLLWTLNWLPEKYMKVIMKKINYYIDDDSEDD